MPYIPLPIETVGGNAQLRSLRALDRNQKPGFGIYVSGKWYLFGIPYDMRSAEKILGIKIATCETSPGTCRLYLMASSTLEMRGYVVKKKQKKGHPPTEFPIAGTKVFNKPARTKDS